MAANRTNIQKTLFSLLLKDRNNKLRCFVPGRLIQASVMFVSEAGTYLSEAHFSCSTLGQGCR